MSNGGPAPPI